MYSFRDTDFSDLWPTPGPKGIGYGSQKQCNNFFGTKFCVGVYTDLEISDLLSNQYN